MQSLTRAAPPALAEYVDRLWFLSDAPTHARERVVPSGAVELVVNLYEDEIRVYDGRTDRVRRSSGAVVSGAFSRFFGIDTREHAAIVGVHFKPGGAPPFIGAPADALADTHVDLEALWGPQAGLLRERLCAARSADDKLGLLQAALIDRLQHPARRHPAVPHALALLDRGIAVRWVAGEVQLSHRRFIEVFRSHVGMCPKSYARVRRFERAAALAGHTTVPDWARIAFACGYSDQSHMIGDFVAFSGFTPVELHRRSNPSLKAGHVLA